MKKWLQRIRGALGIGLTVLGGVIAGASALLGAGSAAGTLAVARAAPGAPGQPSLAGGDETGRAALTGGKAPRLFRGAE